MAAGDRRVALALEISADVDAATRSMDRLGTAAVDMANDVERASRSTEDATSRIDAAAEASDTAATRFSTLAGALGDVAGGLGMIGLGGFSDELEAAAPALMLVAGAADITGVSTETLSAANIKAKATQVAKTVADNAAAAATRAQAAAQWALNIAMRANPVGLIIAAVVALVAAVVIAYKRSERFRAIVQKVGEVGQRAIGWVVDKVGDLVGWVRDKVPAAFNRMRQLAVRYVLLVTLPWRKLIGWVVDLAGWIRDKVPAAFSRMKQVAVDVLRLVTTPQRKLVELAGDLGNWLKDRIPAAFRTMRDVARGALDRVLSPIRTLVDLVEDLVGWIRNIDWPQPPGWLSDLGGWTGGLFGREAAPRSPVGRARFTSAPTAPTVPGGLTIINIKIEGALDPDRTARQVKRLLDGRGRRMGVARA